MRNSVGDDDGIVHQSQIDEEGLLVGLQKPLIGEEGVFTALLLSFFIS